MSQGWPSENPSNTFDCISGYRLIFHLLLRRFSFASNANKIPHSGPAALLKVKSLAIYLSKGLKVPWKQSNGCFLTWASAVSRRQHPVLSHSFLVFFISINGSWNDSQNTNLFANFIHKTKLFCGYKLAFYGDEFSTLCTGFTIFWLQISICDNNFYFVVVFWFCAYAICMFLSPMLCLGLSINSNNWVLSFIWTAVKWGTSEMKDKRYI